MSAQKFLVIPVDGKYYFTNENSITTLLDEKCKYLATLPHGSREGKYFFYADDEGSLKKLPLNLTFSNIVHLILVKKDSLRNYPVYGNVVVEKQNEKKFTKSEVAKLTVLLDEAYGSDFDSDEDDDDEEEEDQ